MAISSWLHGRRRVVASTAFVGVAAVTIATLAVVYEGEPTTELDLNDGSVWLTNEQFLATGHFNDSSRQLDGSVRATSAAFDVRQQADSVLLLDEQTSTVAAVDVATMSMSSPADLQPGADVQIGGSTASVLAPKSGEVFVMPADGIGSFDRSKAEPVAELGGGAAMTVGRDGTVYAASPEESAIYEIPVDANGAAGEPQAHEVEGLGKKASLEIAAVGRTAVVFDRSTGALIGADGFRAEVPAAEAADARLQQTSSDGESVFLATSTELHEFPLAGGEPTATPSGGGEGAPAAPVWLNGCAYSAWASSGAFLRDCQGDAHDEAADLPGSDSPEELIFRVNRDVIVLNDVADGGAWEVVDSLRKVDNWDDLTPPEGEESEEEDDSTDETIEVEPPDRSEENQDPTAADDEIGVRAGRSTVLPVLDNDSDPDGDILTVTAPDGGPDLGEVSTVEDGSAFQIDVQPGVSGSGTFAYEVDDGRGGTDQATVTVEIVPESENDPPEPKREPVVPIEVGGSVTYNVLQDWRDPDGDDVFLTAVEPLPGDGVDFTPDGQVTYRATSGTQGPHDLPITVSDGEASAAGVLSLDIRPTGSSEPIANNDHVVVRAGETTTVAPLANDVNPTTENLRLTDVGDATGARIVPDFANKTFTFSSDEVGTQYVDYLAAAGPNSATGYVRIDVIPDETLDLPPVAVRDVALLPAGGEALVNVLGNDEDPTGGVLVLQSVQVPDDARGVSVAVLNHETLRVTDTGTLADPVTVEYSVSNGPYEATGEVVIIPIPAPTTLQPPVANDDEVTVRVGDVATVDVLENDFHPNDDEMHVLPEVVEPPDPEQGSAFVSQDTVRFKAADEPGTAYVTYEVADSHDQRDSAFITVNILERDDERNQAPRAEDIEARALAGTQAQIVVPLDGIDPDGDSVELIGIDSAPEKGTVVETAGDHFVYEAFPDSVGVDAFSYRVRDRLGAESTATIRVGIAPAQDANQSPYAETDALFVRPGRKVAVPVLTNDSDPDGDQVGLVEDGLVLPEDVSGMSAEVLGDRVVVVAPEEEQETSLQYEIADEKGARATGLVSVTVDEDVPLEPPVARDDTVLIEDVTEELTADVEVLANDEDPDGTVEALELAAQGGELVGEGIVRVSVTEERQVLTYTVTDEDGQEASAFIRVPAVEDLAPSVLTPSPLEVASGETAVLPLDEYVSVQGGGSVRITQADRVSAIHANGEPLVRDATTLVYTSQEGYHGPDAITFEVTDGEGPDDPNGRTSTLTIPVTVQPPENVSPEFTDGSLEIGAGDGPGEVDLAALTDDPDDGDLDRMSYRVTGGQAARIDVSVDGQTLVAEAGPDAQGEQAAIELEISDGESEPVTGTVRIEVTATNRAVPVANDDVLDDAHQGETYTIDVLDNDFNPFPDEELTVVDARIDAGTGAVSYDASSVEVTPGADFHGTMTVMYRVQDATGDPEREAQARVELTVKGRPGAPTEVTGSEEMNRSAIISWRPPPSNGEPITGYTVTSVQGPEVSQECPATTCTITGLTNGQEYSFAVTATNAVGESEPSPPSPPVTPDVKPERPNAPRITDFDDRSLDVAWQAPANEGTPIESYTLSISPAAPDGTSQKTFPAGTLSHTWTGLQNGQSYVFSVAAKNGAKEPSDTSRESAANSPAAPPNAPGKPQISGAEPVGDESQMTVKWGQVTGGAANGDPVQRYQVQRTGGGAGNTNVGVVSAPTVTKTVRVPISTENYTYRVRAENKAGWGAWSAWTDPRRAAAPPGAPASVSATETQTNTSGGSAVVSWKPVTDLNGAREDEVSYLVTWQGGSKTVPNSNMLADGHLQTSIGGLSNGTSYTFRVRTQTSGTGFTYESGSATASNAVKPWGKPAAPTVRASKTAPTKLTYEANRSGASNGRNLTAMQIKWNTGTGGGGGEQGTTSKASWSTTVDVGYEKTRCVQARVQNSEGAWSDWSGLNCATSGKKPKPRVWISKGDRTPGTPGSGNAYPCNDADGGYCSYVRINVENFGDYGGNRTVKLYDSRDGGHLLSTYTMSFPANGSRQLSYYYGFNRDVWVNISGYGDSERFSW
ncbi:Ig-like domain-containing protein [Microbacterium halophytorum]|uniref:Ig-like domain-containing protein n=1 Tax=Microbacterium halophytorum TaxID=2067568 RepID=UPI000CFC70DD|nr:Ig-like domain-containing protein [Microbacterium halophytorum]